MILEPYIRARGTGKGFNRQRVTLWLLATTALLAVFLAAPAKAVQNNAAPVFSDGHGIHVVSVKQIDARQYNVEVLTAALGRPVNVRILVPGDYASAATRRFPVLYLFHGTSGQASDWVNLGGAEQATAALPLIVVMPDAGFDGDGGGWFTNWVDTKTKLGPSQWETFHIDQLIPWVDSNLRTIADRDGRAVAGLSQGGFGSTTYAARHPDLFSTVASFSGAPDIDWNPGVAAGATAVIDATEVGLDGVEPDSMFGSRVTDEINWQGHDPADLVTNLKGVSLWLFTADGLPGPYDPTPANPAAMGIEFATHESTEGFIERAQQQAVPVHVDDYMYGTHSWPYWARDLRLYLVPMMQTLEHPQPAPTVVSYESIDRSWTQWGWSVTLERAAAQQWSSLDGAGRAGFTLTGNGVATVVTPSFYRPGSLLKVTVAGKTELVRVGSDGRLTVKVPFGGVGGLPIPAQVGSLAVIGEPGVPPWGSTVAVKIAP
jgi:S-formylglutathione hydrolase FrmB